ncbi:hypothetical protein [Sporomusa sp. KB1]|jgi:hypothetical protein|uniref:hypothetical protein n=1 Tax=Sporomusa sp. KB1 TaxID=943346 RepID=UPI0011ABA105|nr:hypothetical protein [Sporomusa sp. KB1]TWH46272.1 hypothetical protein Salpa_2247 [Sporomusa sp. KB1]
MKYAVRKISDNKYVVRSITGKVYKTCSTLEEAQVEAEKLNEEHVRKNQYSR